MPFDVRLKITGVCTLVPNVSGADFCVLLPYANVEDALGADGKPMRRHRAFVEYKVADLASGPQFTGDDATGIWYLDQEELDFQCDGRVQPTVAGIPDEVANLSEICADYDFYASVAPSLLPGGTPGADRLSARLVLPLGGLYASVVTGPWIVPNVFRDAPLTFDLLANEVAIDYKDAGVCQLFSGPFGGASALKLDLARRQGRVELTIANLCEDNPLRWDVEDPDLLPDTDFRWHFELLEKEYRDTIVDFLGGADLPFPLPSGFPNGMGRNCFLNSTDPRTYP
jgi:hypothetical protein